MIFLQQIIKGKVLKYGDNINTDIISPGGYMNLPIKEQAKYSMKAIDPNFSNKVKPGKILVVGDNFGSGSSRETAPLILRELGISAIVANFFARIFFRNAINIGLPVVEISDTSSIEEDDELKIDLSQGKVNNLTKNTEFTTNKLPQHLLELIFMGGLEPYLNKQLEE